MIYFITERYLKENTPIQNNVNVDRIDYLFEDVYLIWMKPILGDYFADYLLSKHQDVITGDDNYTDDEEKLVDILQKAMAWGVCFSAVDTLTNQIGNKGAQTQFGDYSNSSQSSERLGSIYNSKFQDYKQLLIDFLVKNREKFSKFTDKENNSILGGCGNNNDDRDIGIMIG